MSYSENNTGHGQSQYSCAMCTHLKKYTGAKLTINVPVVYMGRYEVVLRGDYP
jgi:hypothetical protein